jgi:ArsR family transcriptional regulator, arsenate/arsenite/antimonite-responsive transcriptional repressor
LRRAANDVRVPEETPKAASPTNVGSQTLEENGMVQKVNRVSAAPTSGLRRLVLRRWLQPPWRGEPGDLTPETLFDSYRTMYAGRGEPGQLAPGQFERIAKALADPRRCSLLQTIAESRKECAYQKLCNVFPVSKATISHHMKELVTAGLVDTERAGQFMHARLVPGVIEAYTAELQRRMGV